MFKSLKEYWEIYGGFKAVLKSDYFWIAIFFTIISYSTWLTPSWQNKFLGVIPSLLGFSLAGYAVWLTLGDQNLKKILSKKITSNNQSVFMVINASFIHFIVMQVFAFIGIIFLETNSIKIFLNNNIVITCKILEKTFRFTEQAFNGFIFFLSIYSILVMFAAIFGLFTIAKAMDRIENQK
ncbi:hypothetical protein DBL02_05705 [Acinetobacter oleivorans]|uniref:hypothetical protein n=1 Tax=Acinetobacter oleivorans TaxID=1148157 RepID=UPI000D2FFE0E|nr:hypothetical protein [Acinetobacter oleivorans]PTV45890.1 hypothetical protein DBL02_05705 [Acinetobacter oleivorans]